MKYFNLSLILLFPVISFAQEINYKGFFKKDKASIGDTIYFISIIKYPKNIEIIQPDSSYNYKSFEYINKIVTPSYKMDEKIVDSTIYLIRTFNFNSIQSLELSSYIINNGDSLVITSNTDSISINNQITAIDQSLKVKYNTIYSKIHSLINYINIITISLIIISIIIVVYILFGKKIRTYFKIRKLNKQLKKFIFEYKSQLSKYRTNKLKHELEKLLIIWKIYMEYTSSRPYLSSTTKEIQLFNKDIKTINSLKIIDKKIYSNDNKALESKDINNLYKEAKKSFDNKLYEIKNG
tara:strand:+ start:4780 stop:5664 length:885 start_codon:yes stop_codon:yes gene_type:complete